MVLDLNEFSAFVRRLHSYGFNKVLQSEGKCSGEDFVEYENPLFLRGRPDLLPQIKKRKAATPDSSAPDELDIDERVTCLEEYVQAIKEDSMRLRSELSMLMGGLELLARSNDFDIPTEHGQHEEKDQVHLSIPPEELGDDLVARDHLTEESSCCESPSWEAYPPRSSAEEVDASFPVRRESMTKHYLD